LVTLLPCRLINQYWNSKTISWIQKKKISPVEIPESEFPKFIADFNNTTELPFTKLHIYISSMNLEQCSMVFTKYGASIQDLKIQELNRFQFEEEVQENIEILKCILKNVPNLERLSVCFGQTLKLISDQFIFNQHELVVLPKVEFLRLSTNSLIEGPMSQGFLDGLFTMLPNLKILQLEDMYYDQDWTVFVGALRNPSIRSMEFKFVLNQIPLLRAMSSERAPKLKQLTMWLGKNSNDNLGQVIQSHRALLEYLSDSLEDLSLTLKIYYGYINEEPRLEFPTLQKLKTLTLRSYDDGIMGFYSIVPIEPHRVPELEKLLIDAVMLNVSIFGRSSFSSVQEVIIDSWDLGNQNMHDSLDVLREIGFLFPSLRKLRNLETSLDAKDINMLVNDFPHLDELELKIMRDGITTNFNLLMSGIPIQSGWLLSQIANQVGSISLLKWVVPPGPSLHGLTGKSCF